MDTQIPAGQLVGDKAGKPLSLGTGSWRLGRAHPAPSDLARVEWMACLVPVGNSRG